MRVTKIPNGKVVMNIDKLEEIRSALKSKYVTQVGILGNKTSRMQAVTTKAGYHKKGKQASPMTNAEIGLIHEKGSFSRNIPRRSFLLMPLQQKAIGLNKLRAFLWKNFTSGKINLKKAYALLGIGAENVIQKAFQTGGFGKWPDISQVTKDRKKSSAILIDTAQLRRAVSSRVVPR